MENKDVLLDVGYYLPFCGHRVIEVVWQGEISHEYNRVYFNSENNKNQYVLPLNAIEFVVPHEEEKLHMRKKGMIMKTIIKQTRYCYEYEQIFKDYPILKKYKDKMDYYTGYDDGTNPNYWSERDYSQYNGDNAIVIDLNNNELVKLLQELTNESQLVIGRASKYDHETYGIDFVVEIYDDYRG